MKNDILKPYLISTDRKKAEDWESKIAILFKCEIYSDIIHSDKLNAYAFKIKERHFSTIKKALPSLDLNFAISYLSRTNKNWFPNIENNI